MIAEYSRKNPPQTDLSRKSEWGMPKIPRLMVHIPGSPPTNKEGHQGEVKSSAATTFLRMHLLKGTTRLRYRHPHPHPQHPQHIDHQQQQQQHQYQQQREMPPDKRARMDDKEYVHVYVIPPSQPNTGHKSWKHEGETE